MISKGFAFIIPISMIIALLLSLQGVTYIDSGKETYAFFIDLSKNFNRFRDYEIPVIPTIAQTNVGFLDALITFANMFVQIGNFFVILINAIIFVLEFLLAFITTTGQYIDVLVHTYIPIIP